MCPKGKYIEGWVFNPWCHWEMNKTRVLLILCSYHKELCCPRSKATEPSESRLKTVKQGKPSPLTS